MAKVTKSTLGQLSHTEPPTPEEKPLPRGGGSRPCPEEQPLSGRSSPRPGGAAPGCGPPRRREESLQTHTEPPFSSKKPGEESTGKEQSIGIKAKT